MQRTKAGKRSTSDGSKVTLQMVADRAGVSPSTVSRILNGTAVVSDDKREEVDKAIAELGFVPDPVARGLAGGRTLSIGVVTPAIDSPFYGSALGGIEKVLGPAGYSPLFMSGHWKAVEEMRCIEALRARRVDGLIVLSGRVGDTALRSIAKHLPVVVTGRDLKASGLCALNLDNVAGGRLATEHLIAQGHRRIAFITGLASHPDAVERLKGYREALAAAGLRFDPALVVPGQLNEESGQRAVEQLIESRVAFTAIFAANDQMAFGAALALYRRSLRVPDDVSLVGFDDLASALYAIPPLTTVRQPVHELGRLAATAMLELLAGSSPQMDVPPPQVIVRESTRTRARA